MNKAVLRHFLGVVAVVGGVSPFCVGEEIAVILSSKNDAYIQGLSGFQEAFRSPVTAQFLNQWIPKIHPDTRVIVTFGGKAAIQPYPPHVPLIYCMAPSVNLSRGGPQSNIVKVSMLPSGPATMGRLMEIQPHMKNLAVFWISESFNEYAENLQQEARNIGIIILPEHIEGTKALPMGIRRIKGKADAIYFFPDPLLITPQTFSIIKEFSWANDVPFYAPTDGLVKNGAVASISIDYDDMGKEAARLTKMILDGVKVPNAVYINKVRTAINLDAMEKSGLKISKKVLSQFQKVNP